MTTGIVPVTDGTLIEKVVLHGDLAELSAGERVSYYARVCESLGLNPFTRPFEYIKLNNKLTLYARRDATDQLRKIHNVSVSIVSRELTDTVYVVTAHATIGQRSDESIGAVDLAQLKGEFRANAMMKAETKAKRRVTLSIVGLGFLDETEVADVPKAQVVIVDAETGEIKVPLNPPAPTPTATPTPSQPTAAQTGAVAGKEQTALTFQNVGGFMAAALEKGYKTKTSIEAKLGQKLELVKNLEEAYKLL